MIDFIKVEAENLSELAELASKIWHEYWTIILTDDQIDYMVENFQSLQAIEKQIAEENYSYYFIRENESNLVSPSPPAHRGRARFTFSNATPNFRSRALSRKFFGQKNIGYFGISNKENFMFLSKFYILKDYRHKGVGKTAFKKIKELTLKEDINTIRLTVNKYNTDTITAYKKWGFEITDAVVTDIGSGFVMDDYIMEYYL